MKLTRLDRMPPCAFCGKHKGKGTDHAECSRKLQAKFAGEKRNQAKRKNQTLERWYAGVKPYFD